MIKWIIWIAIASLLVFTGWAIKDVYSETWGRFLMSIGWLLSGFLVIYFAYKNLNNKP
jgi:quinol-cytochrome oxidoreductase complex cytochrome b subunit